jgi:hypothetical protein
MGPPGLVSKWGAGSQFFSDGQLSNLLANLRFAFLWQFFTGRHRILETEAYLDFNGSDNGV